MGFYPPHHSMYYSRLENVSKDSMTLIPSAALCPQDGANHQMWFVVNDDEEGLTAVQNQSNKTCLLHTIPTHCRA